MAGYGIPAMVMLVLSGGASSRYCPLRRPRPRDGLLSGEEAGQSRTRDRLWQTAKAHHPVRGDGRRSFGVSTFEPSPRKRADFLALGAVELRLALLRPWRHHFCVGARRKPLRRRCPRELRSAQHRSLSRRRLQCVPRLGATDEPQRATARSRPTTSWALRRKASTPTSSWGVPLGAEGSDALETSVVQVGRARRRPGHRAEPASCECSKEPRPPPRRLGARWRSAQLRRSHVGAPRARRARRTICRETRPVQSHLRPSGSRERRRLISTPALRQRQHYQAEPAEKRRPGRATSAASGRPAGRLRSCGREKTDHHLHVIAEHGGRRRRQRMERGWGGCYTMRSW